MKVSITSEGKQIKGSARTSTKKPTLFTKKVADRIFEHYKTTIEKRINSGKDLDNKPFLPYRTIDKRGEKVDLRESGDMRKSITYSHSLGKPIEIYYTTAYAKYVDDKRSFIGLTKQEEKGLEKIIDEAMDDYLKALTGRK